MKRCLLFLIGLAIFMLGCSKDDSPQFWNFLPDEVLENKEVVRVNTPPDRFHWNMLRQSEDRSVPWRRAEKQFIQSDNIRRDAPPGIDCPVLKLSIPIPGDGKYSLGLKRTRDFRFSLDHGENWQNLPVSGTVFDDKMLKAGKLQVWLAPAHFADSSTGPRYIYGVRLVRQDSQAHRPVKGYANKRVEENFDRGLSAWEMSPGGSVYLSWRLLKDDPADIAFDIFEITPEAERKCNAAPLRDTTDFTVAPPAKEAVYEVRPAAGFRGISGKCVPLKIDPKEPHFVHKTYRLADPWERISKVGIGDLDGDGICDFVVRHSVNYGEIDPATAYWRPSEAPCKLTAFRSDGTRLWTRSLGWNVEKGIWYAPFLLADLDGDGKAEVIAKTSDDVDRREPDGPDKGKVLSGPEYLTVFDGMTGKILAQAPWPERSVIQGAYGYVSRNQMALAYLDGKTPFLIAERGTYDTMVADAWEFRNGKLRRAWRFDNRVLPLKYWGQGAHTTLAMDVDGDGRDEVILGSSVIDDNGSPLWSTGHGHPDRLLIAPIQGGDRMLFAEQCETPCKTGGICCHDAAKGSMLWELKVPTKHLHTGWFADCDARYRGWLVTATDLLDGKLGNKRRTWTFAPDGTLISESDTPEKSCFWGYWDADLQREKITEFPSDYRGGPVGAGFQGTLLGKADILGDWREEILAAVPGELRIYATTIPAYDRRTCLMQDHNYRATVRAISTGYLPETMLSYLPMDRAVGFSMVRTAHDKIEVTVSAPLNAGVSGEVSLSVTPVGLIDTVPWQVAVEPGRSVTRTFSFHGSKTGMIHGCLCTPDDRVRKVSLPLQAPTAPSLLPAENDLQDKTVLAEAVRFSRCSAGSGFQTVRTGGTLTHKIIAGTERWLEWDLVIPRSGIYSPGVRYASTEALQCAFSVDGKLKKKFIMEPTGGLYRTHNWRELELPLGNAAYKLNKGTHTLRLYCAGDLSKVRLDHVWLNATNEDKRMTASKNKVKNEVKR